VIGEAANSDCKSSNDDAISLSYQEGGTQTTTDRQYSASMIYGAANNTHYTNSTLITPVETAVANSFTQKNPHKINFENGEIEFIQASGRTDLSNSFTLQSILIKNLENGVLSVNRTIDFVYSTFKDRTGGDARLKLTELRIKDATGVEIETYKFDYWTDSFSWKDGTIDYAKKDFFGFYNGQNNAHLLTLGSYNGIPVVGGAANRLTSSTYMKEGVLKQISYPTGGFTAFDYETNRYKHNGTEHLAGGLRVKEIKSYTNPSTLEFMKRYEYGSEDGAGIGKVTYLNWLPETRIVTTDLRHFSFDPIETSTASQVSFAQKDYGEGSYDATPVYYTNVKEYFEEMSTNGSNEYIFSFVPDVISSVVQSTNKEVKQWKRGLLLEQFTRNAQGDVVSHTTNVYQNLKEDSRLAAATVGSLTIYEGDVPRSTQSCSTGFIDNGSLGGTAELSYSAYVYYTGSSKVSQIISVIDGVSTSQSTEYDNNLFVKKTETLESSLNKKYIQESIYPTDPSYDTDTEVLEMRSRNILNVPLESIEKEDNNGSINTLYQQKSVYERFTGTNARGLSQNVLLKEIWVAPKGGTLEKRVSFTDYASNGNPLGYVVDDMPISLVWGYNDALLLAEIKNATKSQTDAGLSTAGITATGMSSTELSSGQLSQLQSLRNALPNSFVSWYSYRPQVGLSGIVTTNGIVNRFAYDKLNRLRSIKDHSSYLTDLYNYLYATTAPIGCTNPDAPTITISSSTLCDATLSASGCSGTINWSNGGAISIGAGGNITVSTKTTTTYTATCTVSGCSSSASNALSVPVLPSGWISADIGTASGGVPPSCTQNNYGTPPAGALALQGSGNVGGSDDSFHWIHKSMSGDFTMILKINSLPVVNGQRSGIMIRSNTNSNAQFYTLIQDGNENVGELKRDTNGGTGGLYSFAGSAANQTWIKVVKTGTSIKGYYSTNSNPEANNAWNDYFNLTGNAPTTLDFGSNYLIGLVTYGSSNQTTFTNITLNGNAF
jgi:hypothetical protein